MSVVLGAIASLAPKLLQLLQSEYELQKNMKRKVEFVTRELESIQAALHKVAAVPWDQLDEQVKVWARQVRDASYDMEDVLDTFLARVDAADPSRLKRAMKKMGKVFGKAKARRSIAGAIEDIKKHLEEVAERRQKYKLDDIMCKPLATTSTIDPRLKAMQLIGVDKSRDELVSMLMTLQPDDGTSNQEMRSLSHSMTAGLSFQLVGIMTWSKFPWIFSFILMVKSIRTFTTLEEASSSSFTKFENS